MRGRRASRPDARGAASRGRRAARHVCLPTLALCVYGLRYLVDFALVLRVAGNNHLSRLAAGHATLLWRVAPWPARKYVVPPRRDARGASSRGRRAARHADLLALALCVYGPSFFVNLALALRVVRDNHLGRLTAGPRVSAL